jgi:hypothetical protein
MRLHTEKWKEENDDQKQQPESGLWPKSRDRKKWSATQVPSSVYGYRLVEHSVLIYKDVCFAHLDVVLADPLKS